MEGFGCTALLGVTALMRQLAYCFGRGLFTIFCVIVAVVAAAYVVDFSYVSGEDNQRRVVGMLELYPYEGFRNRADVREIGDRWNEARDYTEYDYRFGELGLFSDIDVRKPPPKARNEIRVILVGGSGAMGHGARTNEDMLYRKLEGRLTEMTRDAGWYVRVINLAQGGNVSYQSFLALNRWGHGLEPDIILSYSGRNDIWVPLQEGSDAHVLFQTLSYLVALNDNSHRDDEPWLLRRLSEHLPGLYRGSAIPFLLRHMLYSDDYQEIARKRYQQKVGLQHMKCCGSNDPSSLASVKEIAIRTAIHSHRSIKRDFLGIPLVLAWEAMAPQEFPFYLPPTEYNRIYDAVADGLRGYINDDWLLLNVHHEFEADPKPYIRAHLANEGHTAVANLLAERMIDVVRRVAAGRAVHGENGR
jgi:hypothetical protein